MKTFSCQVLHKHSATKARVTRVVTAHGEFITPVFMPVGTRAGVNNMTPVELHEAHSQIILGGNTYHMLCAPGMKVIEQAGGMHPFMGWHGPMLTDSGGFQVFSLSKNNEICTIDEEGAHFKLPGSQGLIHMTPEMSLETQKIIGADIIMAFDQCTPDSCTRDEVSHIMTRTHRWLKQSMDYHRQYPNSLYGYEQALFGIIQGGTFKDLRRESADFVTSMNPDGIAIGGETIGFNMVTTVEVIRWVHDYLPENKPRYTMGVGMSPQDLLDVVAEGVDMFDCVAPTRNARHGSLYCGELVREGNWLRFASEYENERIQIKKSCFADDMSPIMAQCTCYTCRHYSRAYLHQLSKQKTNLFTALASIHNVHVMHDVCDKMRDLIINESAL
ncbi:tRNA guanosine(34) transglycosylase Tgt [Legionella longbeachae]|uniref:Putative queuine tRNA-ribosyltransferase n=1 Tax=Legionella longbeachae serogroup 1 (strain NSW150) TaxID=661367 RepID=D3HP46_LEGLN|nr:tRNA guanosine(34) transglycosylase Tgt [Legionella longbeachae]VEE01187.1 queuine tRNA-ribosyltransferase [Legionella oakridgensis]HBD7398374.1 tRNA guanosine(34) transglycosylase Tgt [Legionella pneumophila]ARB92442.1 tRNA-guanine(34) transglycosylase [Legionella longbeachae]ARM34378.1 tRNA guanosine(34) transglycosylase Tgt [Legionella longbeachae]EEZ96337.1 queuine tRNA-ribosyltransferase [Legionella longbeachae D-4968]